MVAVECEHSMAVESDNSKKEYYEVCYHSVQVENDELSGGKRAHLDCLFVVYPLPSSDNDERNHPLAESQCY